MSEPEKKGSAWPWILVPIASVSLFFVLRECRQSLPAAAQAAAPEVAVPAAPAAPVSAETGPSDPEAAPVANPALQ
jgi:hypothetical protein